MSPQNLSPADDVRGAGAPVTGAANGSPVLELKAAAFTLPVIRLLALDMDAVEAQLAPKVEQAPGFFRNTPVVIDLAALSESDADVGFPQLVGLLRGLGMIPVGVRGGSASQHEAAKAMELAILGDAQRPRQRLGEAEGPAETLGAESVAESRPSGESRGGAERTRGAAGPSGSGTGAERPAQRVSMLVDRPVRSGQRIYAAGSDLTVVAPVSSGAELMADGNIHIYAPLRGRVIAGLKGDAKARIFCSDLQAELVSVAGHYRVSENIPVELKGKQVQVFLDNEVLRIEPL